ncbi:unnamed protein product [Paramecium sonneborni]|uniref:Uncharacterized protein n=1 Tax=Paramecium sonneborni TaxID=65129 RepID=A0A8S1QQM5_9CILI|nr:unnamed protein product [Paramecium sonneborni]
MVQCRDLLKKKFIFKTPFFLQIYQLLQRQIKNTVLISLDSKQKGIITFQNINIVFYDNHLDEYFYALSQSSSATLFLSLKYNIKLLIFIKLGHQFNQFNLIYDSQNIKNSQFQNNNILNYSSLNRYILLKNTQDLTDINFQFIFPIKSTSGNGMLISKLIMIDSLKINFREQALLIQQIRLFSIKEQLCLPYIFKRRMLLHRCQFICIDFKHQKQQI